MRKARKKAAVRKEKKDASAPKSEKPLTREGLGELTKALRRFNMEPLDFYTIDYLFNLEVATRESMGMDIGMDAEFRGDILRALLRKAQLHHREGDSFGKEVLQRMELWRDE